MEPATLYDRNAARWSRSAPNSISDFTGRPAVFDLCGPVAGQRVLDLGCGEGYCSREMAGRGAARVVGVDVSEEMIALGRERERGLGQGIEYHVGDVVELALPDDAFDLVLGVFVFSYVDTDRMARGFAEARRVLAPGGRFVFAVPHPSLAFQRPQEPPFYFDTRGAGYFTGRDVRHGGEIACVDGTRLPVQMVHKTLEDYFDALARAGFERMPIVRELCVLPEHLTAHPTLFAPLRDVPLHLAMRMEG